MQGFFFYSCTLYNYENYDNASAADEDDCCLFY